MNKLDFNIKAGWPASTETWEYLQNMILQAQNASLLGGQNYIVSGCVLAGGNMGDGIVVVNGEVLPFTGGPLQAKIIVVDTPTNRQFFGGVSNPYYHARVAMFGTGAGEVLYSSFKRNDPANGVLARLDKMERMLKPLMGYTSGGTTVYGSWLFWGRPEAEIPEGWEPVPDADWKGRVPVVLNDGDVRFSTVGNTGGETDHTLLQTELPAVSIEVKIPPGKTSVGEDGTSKITGGGGANEPGGANSLWTEPLGSGVAFNVMQPYKVVMFIRFAG